MSFALLSFPHRRVLHVPHQGPSHKQHREGVLPSRSETDLSPASWLSSETRRSPECSLVLVCLYRRPEYTHIRGKQEVIPGTNSAEVEVDWINRTRVFPSVLLIFSLFLVPIRLPLSVPVSSLSLPPGLSQVR